MNGKVYLVGAGPGDPELLTLKAVRVLKLADVVLHDDLVSAKVLDLVPTQAQRYNVGKRCGKKNISQLEINSLVVSLASQGLCVVRLKGGDPMLFGRGAEEITALRAAKIDFAIVPGVTAALGASSAAHIPLTDRRSAHAVVFLAGHHAREDDPTNWQALVELGATIVVYMPGSQPAALVRKLQSAGMAQETPCILISRATTEEEQALVTTLGNLPNAAVLAAPTLLVIGEVARDTALLHPQALWDSLLSSNREIETGFE